MKYLISVVETYRVDTEEEAKELIEEAKASNLYDVKKYTNEHKEIKETKTHEADAWERVCLTKIIQEEKDPCRQIEIEYKVED